ncbi:MAG: DNA polymerase III subunit gamma/tau [Sulfuricellaceae bacterium]|jgi:DNA polymerase-3 subunit gamma/tau
MSYQVLARKWRPKTFAEVVGQGHVVQALSNALEHGRLHHAYLLTGTRGVGKTTLARILAKSLNCETGVTATPCGECTACREIDAGRFVDLLELDAASNTGVDNMREILDNAQYAPTAGRYKVYLIDEVHMLSKSAFNSMLKTLEEPPAHVKFILATTDPQKVPITVLSRCLQFNLKHLPPVEIAGQLKNVLEREGIPFEAQALSLVARAAQGSMRDALSLLDQAIAYGGGKVEEAQVRGMLGSIDQGYLFSLLEALSRRDGPSLLATAEEMEERGLAFDAALQELGVLLHQVALAKTVPQALPDDLPERARVLELAEAFGAEDVQLYYQIALHGRRDLPLAPDEYAGFTMTLLRMLAFAPDEGGAMQVSAPRANPGPAAERRPIPPRPAPVDELRPQAAEPPPPPSQEAPRPAATASAMGFDGDWPGLVERLKIGGMAKMLAQHCELRSYENDAFDLCVPEEHRHLTDPSFQAKLKASVDDLFGRPMRLNVSVGAVTGMTPAAIQGEERRKRQEEAIAAIEQDPFVRELVETMDARIIESTIKPVQ